MAYGSGLGIGPAKRGKGMKSISIVESQLIAALGQHARSEPLRSATSQAGKLESANRASDSHSLDAELRKERHRDDRAVLGTEASRPRNIGEG